MKKTAALLAVTAVLVSGCSEHKNPLINDKTIAYLRNMMGVGQPLIEDEDMITCGKYYAKISGAGNDQLDQKCDQWSKKAFEELQVNPIVTPPYQATIQDFRDPALWKIALKN